MDSMNIEKRGVISGLLISAILVAFFFIVKSIGLIHNYELRGLNAFIMFFGVFVTIRMFKKSKNGLGYLQGMSLGLLTALTTAVSFSIFVLLYLVSDPAFMQVVRQNEPHGIYLNEYGISIVIFIEAAASGLIFSFMSMQWLKEESFAKAFMKD